MEETTGCDCDNVIIRFVVQTTQHQIFQTQHELYVVGNIAELGNWNPSNGTKMQKIAPERFEASISIPKNIQKIIEYKYVTLTNQGDERVHLEHEENRIIQKYDFKFTQIQDHYRDVPPVRAPIELVTLDRMLGRTPEPKICLDVPTGGNLVLVRFTLRASSFALQCRIGVLGNCDQLGNLVAERAAVMQYTYPNWELEIYVPKNSFPLKYKYVLRENHYYRQHQLEVGPYRCIDLPQFDISPNDFAVQVHDDFLNQAGYYGITTAESVSRPLIELSQKTNCQVSDLLYIEDNQFVVCCQEAFDAASTYRSKPIKKVRNISRYYLFLSGSTLPALEALSDPECSFREMNIWSYGGKLREAEITKFSEAMKQNRTISSVKIVNEDTVFMENFTDENMTWFFNGLANNEFPFVTSLFIDTLMADWNLKPIYQLLKTNTSLKTIKLICFKDIDTCQLCQILEVNDSLTELDVWAENIDCTLLARTIERRKRKLKSLIIKGANQIDAKLVGLLAELHFEKVKELSAAKIEEIFKELKNSKVTTKFSISAEGQYADYLTTMIKSVFETNWILMDFSLWCAYRVETKDFIKQMCDRNLQFQKQRHINIVMILQSIKRNSTTLDLFPREVWLHIFSYVESPLGYNYPLMLDELFKNNSWN